MALWQSCLPLLAVAASPMMGMDLAVCSDRPAAVDSMTEMEVRKELTRIARRSGLEVRFGPCSRETAIRIHLLSGGSPDEPTALGAAPIRHGQIGPDLRIFTGPVAQLVGTRMPGLLGAALARVAAHELGHFLRQDSSHDRDGELMSEALTGPKLIAVHEFRIAMRH